MKKIVSSLTPFLLPFGLMIAAWLFIWITKIGILPDTMHWNSIGIPVLGIQVWISVILVSIVSTIIFLVDDRETNFWIDFALFLGIWILTAIIWISTPASSNFFAPGPYPPNFESYPFSDAKLYDISAQFALIDQGFNNGAYVSKPFYTFFLYILHLITGNNFSSFLNLHVILLGSFPAFVYIFGAYLHRRATGLLASIIVFFVTINTSNINYWIQVSHPKLLLTENLLAIFFVLLSLLITAWYQRSDERYLIPAAIGGLFGFATLLRHNVWALLPMIFILALIRYRRKIKNLLAFYGAFAIALILAISPWMIYSYKSISTPWYFLIPLQGSVINHRYLPELSGVSTFFPSRAAITGSEFGSNKITLNTEPGEKTGIIQEWLFQSVVKRALIVSSSSYHLQESAPWQSFSDPIYQSEPDYQFSEPKQEDSEPKPINTPTEITRKTRPPDRERRTDSKATQTPVPFETEEPEDVNSDNAVLIDWRISPPAIWREPFVYSESELQPGEKLSGRANIVDFVIRHWFHNLVAAAMTLPTAFGIEGSSYIIDQRYPYWAPNWNGYMELRSIISLAISLAVVSVGIGWGWKKLAWRGLIPLFVFLTYNLGTALARTSGGRYIVPVQWVVYLYYGMGLVFLFLYLFGLIKWKHSVPSTNVIKKTQITHKNSYLAPVLLLLAILLIGSFIPLSSSISKPSISAVKSQSALDFGEHIAPEDMQSFLLQEHSVLISGYLLYPRFYPAGIGEPTNIPAYQQMDFSRLIFEMIGTDGEVTVVIPQQEIPAAIPNGSFVTVLGCRYSHFILADFVAVTNEEEEIIFASSQKNEKCGRPE